MSDEKLTGVDDALAELGKSDEDVSAVRDRFADGEPTDLEAVDSALGALAEGVSLGSVPTKASTAAVEAPKTEPAPFDQAAADADGWDTEHTEVDTEYTEADIEHTEPSGVEIIDSDDFVLLVDEDELEELEKAAEHDGPPPPPDVSEGDGEEEEGFFKKLFGSRRNSNRP